MLYTSSSSTRIPSLPPHHCNDATKKKRRPAGTPDPDAEVLALSPQTLLESNHYICEICNLGFQREQNLQMHRRSHKVPWKLLKREAADSGGASRKRVFVCPEPTCLHNDPGHALGDLVGIKKHYRRKHSKEKKWVCDKCSKGYAVQSDYKAHLKTCGTRGHSCDCGKVFSRVESFIEHQDSCNMGLLPLQTEPQQQTQVCPSRTASSPSLSSDTNPVIFPNWNNPSFRLNPINNNDGGGRGENGGKDCSLELRLMTAPEDVSRDFIESTGHLRLSIGSYEEHSSHPIIIRGSGYNGNGDVGHNTNNNVDNVRTRRDEVGEQQLRMAMEEKEYAEEARKEARRELEMAEKEFEDAKRMRQRARVELDGAGALKEHAAMEMELMILRITCHGCKRKFQSRIPGV